MSTSCTGRLDIGNGEYLENIFLDPCPTANVSQYCLPGKASLRFLSVVETSRIPLHLTLGTQYLVCSDDARTGRWFRGLLLASSRDEDGQREWWRSAVADSPMGVLVAVDQEATKGSPTGPRVTEVLFYVSREGENGIYTPPGSPTTTERKPNTETFNLHALLLSSDLLCQAPEPTPPTSPIPTTDNEDIHAVFLPPPVIARTEIIHELQPRKRKTVTDTFDEAALRRQKARCKGGEGVSAAASTTNKALDALPTLKTRRSEPVQLQTRPLSRSPSLSGPQQLAVGAVQAAPKRTSSLSHVQAAPAHAKDSQEVKNKDLIARTVMAGMRLWGLSQSKNRQNYTSAANGASKHRASSAALSPALSPTLAAVSPDTAMENKRKDEETRRQDEEFKLMYHQVYRGVCFAFRAHITSPSLGMRGDALREMVDRFLGMFCTDPLEAGLMGGEGGGGGDGRDEVTPGGRKAFGSSAVKGGEVVGTPSGRRRG